MPSAGIDFDAVLDGRGLFLVPGTLRRFSSTNFSPSVRNTDPSYSDFSTIQHWVKKSWHHGRGALEFEDPLAYYDSAGVQSKIRNQIMLSALQILTTKAASASVAVNPLVWKLFTSSANLWMAGGGASRDVFQWTNASTIWAAETAGLAADPTDMAEFRSNIFVACGEANVMRKKVAGTWSAASDPADYLATFGNQVLYRADNLNEIHYTTVANPGSTDWIGPIYVGDTNTQIRSLLVAEGKLFVGKDDGLYFIQDQRAYQLLDVSWGRDSNNFKSMKYWNGALYFPILDGLYRLIGSSLQAIGPERGAAGSLELGVLPSDLDQRSFKGLNSGKTGRIVDLIPTENFLYAVVDGSTSNKSQIISYNGSGWNQEVEGAATNKRIQSAFFTGVLASSGHLSNPRLWYGYDVDAYNIILPFGTEDPYDYTGSTYAASGTLDEPWYDAGLANVYKEWHWVFVYSEGLTSTEVDQISYEVDDLGAFQNLVDSSGAAYAFTSSPYQLIKLPANTIGKKIRIRHSLSRGGTTTLTPKVKAFVVGFNVRPDIKYGWQVVTRAGRKMANQYTKNVDQADPTEWLQQFMNWQNNRHILSWDDGNIEPGITNLILNPEFRLDSNSDGLADSWTKIAAPTTSLDRTILQVGLRSQKVVTSSAATSQGITQDVTIVSGTRYTLSAWVYVTSGDRVTLQFRGKASVTSVGTGSWQRLEVTWVADGTTGTVDITRAAADGTAATTFYVAGVQVEITPDRRAHYDKKATSFCSGEQPRCFWVGAPHASTSTRAGSYEVYLSNIAATEIKRPSLMERIRGIGIEHRTVFSLIER